MDKKDYKTLRYFWLPENEFGNGRSKTWISQWKCCFDLVIVTIVFQKLSALIIKLLLNSVDENST